VLAILEQMGLPRQWIGFIFLLATVALYAGIGIMSRTTDAAEYYVAGRRVPAIYNGMATGADWMSAASFIGMAGTLYLTGYGGLAFIMGWTGGYCLVALFLAPYLRKFGQFTIPDFLGARYGGNLPRLIGILAAILCSFTYVVAQIYGVGLITTRLSGLAFEIGIFVGLGGILVCSLPGRHARGDVDAGRAVHHPDHRLHDPGGVAVGEADRRAHPAGRLRLPAAEGDRCARRS
jgi:cation/acetate symporter